MYSCCFTGHRPQSLPFGFKENDSRCLELKMLMKKYIEKLIVDENVTHFISGMAIGVDMYAAEIVLELKEKYPFITLEAAIPCESQPNKWSVQLQKRYHGLLQRCDKKTLVQKEYTPDCMHKRNRYMVDNSLYVMAIWNGKPSGTGKTVEYAKKTGKGVIIIDPMKNSFPVKN